MKNQSNMVTNFRAHFFFSPSWIDALESTKSASSGACYSFEEEKTYPSRLTELPLTVRY